MIFRALLKSIFLRINMSVLNEFIAQFSSFRARPQRRDLELRKLRIRGLRSVLTFVIAVTTLMFLFSYVLSAFKPKRNLQQELVKGDSLVFDKPSFTGHTASGGRIIVTASEATRTLQSDQGDIVLKNPVVTTQTGSKLTANSGTWNQIKQKLMLREAVKMRDNNGNTAIADYAFWGVLENASQGQAPTEEQLYLTGNVSFIQPSGEAINAASAIWNETSAKLNFISEPIAQIAGPNAKSARVNGKIAGGTIGAGTLLIDTQAKIAYGKDSISINSQAINAWADSFEFHFDSKHLILRGKARASYATK